MPLRRVAILVACAAASTLFAAPAAGAGPVPLAQLVATTPAGAKQGHLVSTYTGRRWTPRCVNYVRVKEIPGSHYHSTFEPGRYSAAEADRVLAALARDGYNCVRVFIDPGSDLHAGAGYPHGNNRGANSTLPVYGPYMDNVGDFVRRATAYRIRVLPSIDGFPTQAYYRAMLNPGTNPNIAGRNLQYMHPGWARAKAAYLRHFIQSLRARVGAQLLTTILAYQIDNEAHVDGSRAPFHRMSGTVKPLNGVTYDMSSFDQRQQAQDASIVEYVNRMVQAVRSEDARSLVTMGVFTYGAVGKNGPAGLPYHCDGNCDPQIDYRYPARAASVMRWSTLSFLDLHVYPSAPKPYIYDPVWSLDAALRTIEWDWVRGPVILGEFGALRSLYGGDVVRAAYAMRDLQVDSCRRGLSGWAFWTFDTMDTATLRLFFNLNETRGAINGLLAPIRRGDPCIPGLSAYVPHPEPPAPRPADPAPAAPAPAPKATLRARVERRKLPAALRKGLRVRVTAPFAGRATVRALSGRRVVGRGARRVPAGSGRAVTVRFGAKARRRLLRRRAVRLSLRIAVHAGDRRVTAKRRVTLRR